MHDKIVLWQKLFAILSTICSIASTTRHIHQPKIESVKAGTCQLYIPGSTIFADEFDGPAINTTKWIIEHMIPTYTGPSNEFNTYEDRDDVRFIQNGKLYIKPKVFTREEDVRGALDLTEGCTSQNNRQCYYQQISGFILPPVISAKIKSKVSFKYGKVEVRAKLPKGDWIYPIIELEPKNKIEGENSPKIWIAYTRGNFELKGNIPEEYGSRLLFGGPVLHPSEPERSKVVATIRSEQPYNNDFHLFTLDWKPGSMKFYVDSVLYGDIPTTQKFSDPAIGLGENWIAPEAPFDREYVLVLGVGIGGIKDFPDGFNSVGDHKPWLNAERFPVKKFFDARDVWSKTWKGNDVSLQVDYVKVTAV